MNIKKYPVYLSVVEEIIQAFNYGDIISNSWLIEKSELNVPDMMTRDQHQTLQFQYMAFIEGVKIELLENHLMALESVRGTGYRIVMPSDQSTLAMTNLKNSLHKELSKCVKTISFINENLLTDESLKLRDSHRGKIAALAAFSKNTLKRL